MDHQNYVTPESDNALKYVRLIQNLDAQDAEARRLETDIFNRAWDQGRAAATRRQHQEALDVFTQLKAKYPNPPIGAAVLQEAIQEQGKKLELYQALKKSFSAQVKHSHGRGLTFWRTRECSGSLQVDGFAIEFKSLNEPQDSFRISYEGLGEVKFSKDQLTLTHAGIRPEGKIELQAVDTNAVASLEQVYRKIMEYRDRYAEYMK